MTQHTQSPVILYALAVSLSVVYGGKVLVFPADGSHWVNMNILIEELHDRGHSITVVRPTGSWYIKETSAFYNSITVNTKTSLNKENIQNSVSCLLQTLQDGPLVWRRLKVEMELMRRFQMRSQQSAEVVERIMDDRQLMQTLRDGQFDLVLVDSSTPGGAILAHYLGLPLIFSARHSYHGEAHFAIAPSPLSYVPVPFLEFTDKMSFSERVVNVLFFVFYEFLKTFVHSPCYSHLIEKHLGPHVSYSELMQTADLWLMRTDFVFEFPRPTMPNVVYVGGFQCKPAKPLPPDLEDFAQSSGENGLIVMSLGTFVSALPTRSAEEMAAAFAQLPQKVVWRHTGSRPSTLGNNTLLVEWMPQHDLLGHSKTRLFVSHGGNNGIQEAVYYGVPILGVPLMFDQPDNLSRMRGKGAALLMDISLIDRRSFLQALQEMLHEPSYRQNMQRLSRLHRDQQTSPLERAVFWMEFVMRHKGAAHLRTESYKMPWYSYHSVDVMAFLLTSVSFLCLSVLYCVRYSCCLCFKRKLKHD